MAEWTIRVAGRTDEMSHGKLSLQIEIQPDGDAVLAICEDGVPIRDKDNNIARVEFCDTASGGGASPNTLRALTALYREMLIDGIEKPEGIPKFPIQLAGMMAAQSAES